MSCMYGRSNNRTSALAVYYMFGVHGAVVQISNYLNGEVHLRYDTSESLLYLMGILASTRYSVCAWLVDLLAIEVARIEKAFSRTSCGAWIRLVSTICLSLCEKQLWADQFSCLLFGGICQDCFGYL